MKRTPLRRKNWLNRKATRVRRRSAYKERPRDMDRINWIWTLPCAARKLSGCFGRVEADHAGRRGIGRKAPDDTCIPLCSRHHGQRDAFKGPFREWDQQRMRHWLATLVEHYQKLYEERGQPA
jgi:hypothetical protein